MVAPFEIVPQMIAVSNLVTNEDFIADSVCPRISVSTKTFQYKSWDVERAFTFPNSLVGRISRPNQIEDKWVLNEATCLDHGFDRPIPGSDMVNAMNGAGVDLRLTAAEYLTGLLQLAREQRVANLVFNSSNYAGGLSTTLVGNAQWTDKVNSTPLDDVLVNLEVPLLRPNTLVFGLDAWLPFRTHPQIVEAVRGANNQNAAQQGVITESEVAALFNVRQVLVGRARINSAKKGLSPSLGRVFGDSLAMIHINTSVRSNFDEIPTFCFTAQFGQRIAGTISDPNLGLMGGLHARVGESVIETPIADQAGFLFQDVAG